MPSGMKENDSFEKDEELANGFFSKSSRLGSALGLQGKELPGTLRSQLNPWGSSSLPYGKNEAPISKESCLKGPLEHQSTLNM